MTEQTDAAEVLSDEAPNPALRETPTGWLATGTTYPRIGVLAETREAAVREYEHARARWLATDAEANDA